MAHGVPQVNPLMRADIDLWSSVDGGRGMANWCAQLRCREQIERSHVVACQSGASTRPFDALGRPELFRLPILNNRLGAVAAMHQWARQMTTL